MIYSTALYDGSGFAKAAFSPGKRMLAHRFLSRVFKVAAENPGVEQVVAWDAEDNVSERLARFPSYKESRRKPKPPGFRPSLRDDPEYGEELPELRRLLPLLGVSQALSPGWEADDVLGTLARRVRRPVLVLTRDRDLLQLVGEEVDVLLRIGSSERVWTPEKFKRDRGFHPQYLKDWKALAGDSGDDVPGMPGIGEKYATEIVQTYPELVELAVGGGRPGEEDVEASGLRGRAATLARKAIEDPERLELMRWLVELHDVPIQFVRARSSLERAREKFAEAGLRTLRTRLGDYFGSLV